MGDAGDDGGDDKLTESNAATLKHLLAGTLMNKYYAHSLEGQPPEKWQPLEEHLENVAEMTAEFARYFGFREYEAIKFVLVKMVLS